MSPHRAKALTLPAVSGLAFALAAYVLAMLSMLAFFDFLAGTLLFPFGGVDHGPVGIVRQALIADLALLALFGASHSVMARPAFKAWWTRLIPPHLERSTYILVSALTLGTLVILWQPVPGTLWSAPHEGLAVAVDLLFATGAMLTLVSTFQISHTELFGLAQPWAAAHGAPLAEGRFRVPPLYRVVRHPMQLGILVTLWATPVMTVGRLLLAVVLTAYVLIGLAFEERALLRHFGQFYIIYQEEVRALLPAISPRRLMVVGVWVLVANVIAAGAVAHSGVSVATLEHGGLTRRFRIVAPSQPSTELHVMTAGLPVFIQPASPARFEQSEKPRAAPRPRPILFVLHGRGQDGALVRRLIGPELEPLAAARGWIVVYPDGHERSWNDCRASLRYAAHEADVPDVEFLRALARRLAASHGADTSHMMALGYSNGGHLAHRLAAESGEIVRSIAVFGANLPAESNERCVSQVATLFVAGADDRVNPAAGGAVRLPTGGTGSPVLSATESAEFVATCEGGARAESLVLPGVGHELPVTRGRLSSLRRLGRAPMAGPIGTAVEFLGGGERWDERSGLSPP
jgi:poly(3-hydroxybutyrate) depolymerase/protein-S-isoprenylcysteine O-methyltransferase Ste14